LDSKELFKIISYVDQDDQLAVLEGLVGTLSPSCAWQQLPNYNSLLDSVDGEVHIRFCFPPPPQKSCKAALKAYRKLMSAKDKKRVLI